MSGPQVIDGGTVLATTWTSSVSPAVRPPLSVTVSGTGAAPTGAAHSAPTRPITVPSEFDSPDRLTPAGASALTPRLPAGSSASLTVATTDGAGAAPCSRSSGPATAIAGAVLGVAPPYT